MIITLNPVVFVCYSFGSLQCVLSRCDGLVCYGQWFRMRNPLRHTGNEQQRNAPKSMNSEHSVSTGCIRNERGAVHIPYRSNVIILNVFDYVFIDVQFRVDLKSNWKLKNTNKKERSNNKTAIATANGKSIASMCAAFQAFKVTQRSSILIFKYHFNNNFFTLFSPFFFVKTIQFQ